MTPFFITSQLLFASYIWTIIKFSYLRHVTNAGFGMPMPPTEVVFLNALMDDMTEQWANIPFLISLICGFTWIRTLAAMTNSEVFGPKVFMILKMISDILEFLFIYILQLMAFALVASMAFVQINEFNDFYKTILYLFNASFGSYNLSLFDQYEKDEFKYMG